MLITKIMDHLRYQKRMKGLTMDSLRFIIKDAKEAVNAMPDNPNNGYYLDEIHYAGMEIQRRIGK